MYDGANILVTGGTGSFGQEFIRTVLHNHEPERLIVFSRDELKQSEMAKQFPDTEHDAIRFFLGDIRDPERLRRAMAGVDLVVHAAALKQVPACEYNPIEAVKTNIHGAENIINAAIDMEVPKVIALSTDKAVNPVNLYGATKLVSEKLFIAGNAYAGRQDTNFSCVRYGNVIGSRGSVVPLFLSQRAKGRVTVTDPRMTRFWLTLEQGVRFVLESAEQMHGGEIFVPKIPSMNIMDLAEAVAPDCQIDELGIRPGEKLHEILLSVDEARESVELEDRYVIQPRHTFWNRKNWSQGTRLPEDFSYSSDNNPMWLTVEQIRSLIGEKVMATI